MDKNSVKDLWNKHKGKVAVVSTGVAVVAITAAAMSSHSNQIQSANICKFLYEHDLLKEYFKDELWMVDVVNQTYHLL